MLWEDNYLAHYGITGQKWGVRRFQNPDGSLTEAGKKRYEADSNRSSQSNALESKGHGLFSRVKKKAYTQTVQSEGEWIRKAGEMVADPKARKKIIKAIDEFKRENPEEAEASRKKSVWLENCMDYYNESYRESSHRWHKDNPGKEWVGDAAEFGNELEKKYPDYKKAKEQFDKAIADYVDDVNKLANNPKFKDMVDLNNYPNLSEKIEGRDGTWYRTANALAWGIASVDSKREINNGYIMPEYFIESRDSNGNILPSPYLLQVNKKEDHGALSDGKENIDKNTKVPKSLSNEERDLAKRILKGEIVDDEKIYKMANDCLQRERERGAPDNDYGEYDLTRNFIYHKLFGTNLENKYKKEIQNETDPRYIDPSYRKFNSKEEKAKAEADYLSSMIGENDFDKDPKGGREVEHLMRRVWNLSMDGYEGVPNSERTRKLFIYNGDKEEYDQLWEPKYKQSKEYKELQAKKEELKESTGFNKADQDMRGQPAKGIFAGLKDIKTFDSYEKAYKKYKEALKNSKISDSEKAMEKAFEQKVCKSVLLDLGYEVNPQNIDLIKYIIWFD